MCLTTVVDWSTKWTSEWQPTTSKVIRCSSMSFYNAQNHCVIACDRIDQRACPALRNHDVTRSSLISMHCSYIVSKSKSAKSERSDDQKKVQTFPDRKIIQMAWIAAILRRIEVSQSLETIFSKLFCKVDKLLGHKVLQNRSRSGTIGGCNDRDNPKAWCSHPHWWESSWNGLYLVANPDLRLSRPES